MSTVAANAEILETATSDSRRFGDLRGVRWRIDLGILPSWPSASVDDLRRVTADSRRRYAALRRQLLVDPHVPKDGSSSPDHVIDNPLSQSPDSIWGRFFRNAELEKMVDQDLTRLYPERSCGYFQTSRCQGILRRILLLWCLQHPEYGYRQGMHELLAPLLYVLHVDVERLSEVRKIYEDQFADKFDGFSFHENDFSYKFDFRKFSESIQEDDGFENNHAKATITGPTDLDSETQTIVLLSDAYGAEGELGIVLSEKFMEHDAYSMFDSLMSGSSNGEFAMSDFYLCPSHSGLLPPVIESSAAFYHLLSKIDMSLYTHLVELGVEPQYFGLRWLRLLFGREFSLEDLLVIWDEIFSCENTRSNKPIGEKDSEFGFGVLESSRGAFICAFGVSMILNLRSSLLATENATACLQRLLNFPNDVKIVKLLSRAKSLHKLALEANSSIPLTVQFGLYSERISTVASRGHSLSLDLNSPKTPLNIVANSYWEEKWRVLNEEKEQENMRRGQVPSRRNSWSERVRHRLSRTESDPTPSKMKNERDKFPRASVRRSLLNDLAKQLGADEDNEVIKECDQESEVIKECDQESVERHESTEVNGGVDDAADDKSCEIFSGSEEINNYPDFQGVDDVTNGSHSENEKESERCSVGSKSVIGENDIDATGAVLKDSILQVPDQLDCLSSKSTQNESIISVSDHLHCLPSKTTQNESLLEKSGSGTKERKPLSSKFQWLWKFGRNSNNNNNNVEQSNSEGRSAPEDSKASEGKNDNDCNNILSNDGCDRSSKSEVVDQNLMVTLNNIGQSMLENIQVIETVFQHGETEHSENSSKNSLVGKGQVTATAALKELRKISNLLSEM